MTLTTTTELSRPLRRAVVRATLAPSVYNSQPWRFVLHGSELQVHADPARRLPVLDPAGRQSTISCGCALFNARVALNAAGYRDVVDREPHPGQPTLLARITGDLGGAGLLAQPDPALAALDPLIELRRTNRREFAPDPVPDDLVELLVRAAAAEDAILHPIHGEDDLVATAVLSQRADRQQNADPAYRAELRAWTSNDARRVDGVTAAVVPRAGGGYDELPLRDFDLDRVGSLPSATHSSTRQSLLLLGTMGDNPAAWLRAGEALERVLLELTRSGYVASPLTQVVEVPATRAALRRQLRLAMHPHVLLRVGRAEATPATRRRRLVDMLTETP